MKKVFTLLIISLLLTAKLSAQTVDSYNFISSAGTYEKITGGTVVYQGIATEATLSNTAYFEASTPVTATTTAAGFPIGFGFTYNDKTVDRFAISPYGLIYLGNTQVTADPSNTNDAAAGLLYSNTAPVEGKTDLLGLILQGSGQAIHVYGDASTEIRYETTGSAPNRVLVVQFTNLLIMTGTSGATRTAFSHQIRLYETTNKIEFVFNEWGTPSGNKTMRVGIKGSIASEIHLRNAGVAGWASTTKTANGNVRWSSTVKPANGLTYTFSIPPACATPTAQPTALQFKPATNSISGSFTPEETANYYLTLISESSTLGAAPVDGTTYTAGNAIGAGKVLGFSVSPSFTANSLEANKTYHFFVFSAIADCVGSGAPLYYTTSPLTGMQKTMPLAPEALTIAEGGFTSVTLAATSNANGDSILIASYSGLPLDTDGNNNLLNDGAFVTPTSDLNVGNIFSGKAITGRGDEVDMSAKVVYKGLASEAINIEGLTPDVSTHFAAWSYDADGNVSSTLVKANTLTWGVVPYNLDFGQFPAFHVPLDWEQEREDDSESFAFRIGTARTQLECEVRAAGMYNSFTTQWIQLAEGTNKLIFDINLTRTTGTSATGYSTFPYTEWAENDSIEFQVIKPGDTPADTVTIYTIKKANDNIVATGRLYIPFDTFAGERVKVKVKWLCNVSSAKLLIKEFKIEEKLACDYPINLSVREIKADSAFVRWTPQNGETLWDVRYKVGTGEWGEAIEVDDPFYQLTGLPANTSVSVLARAKCSLITQSLWSDTLTFTSEQSGLPFSENFAWGTGNNLYAYLLNGWTILQGIIGTPTVLASVTASSSTLGYISEAYGVSYASVGHYWLMTPTFDFGDGSKNYQLQFDIRSIMGDFANLPATDSLVVVVSEEDGETFNASGIKKVFTSADENFVVSIGNTISLIGLTGTRKIAFYFSIPNPASGIFVGVDNVSITPTCPSVVSGTPEVSDITTTGAKVTWKGPEAEWLVFIREKGETAQNYNAIAATDTTFTGLTALTDYEVGITHSCAPGDTAQAVIVSFTTLSDVECPEVTDITEVPSSNEVTINWETTRDAVSYNVFIRPVGYEGWITKKTTEKSIVIGLLEENETYEYRIQAICSAAAGDESDSTEVRSFYTPSTSCFAPTNLVADPLLHRSATISWESDNTDFELQWREGTGAWTPEIVADTFKVLAGLTPETEYSVRVRTVCDANDKSAWSTVYAFTTAVIPVCPTPANLHATGITSSSATLEWNENEQHITWDLRYREGSGSSWTEVKDLEENSYLLTGLQINTAYLWRVKAYCDEDRESNEATQVNFTTTDGTSIGAVNAGKVSVFASKRIINILNPDDAPIERVQIYDVNGSLLQDFTIRSVGNILIPTTIDQSSVVVKVSGKNTSSVFKVLIK